MHVRPLPILGGLLALMLTTACMDGPCANVDGPVLYAWDDTLSHRLEGTNPLAYDSIAGALDAATPGTTVCVSAGVWQEELTISKDNIHLRGAGSGRTIIEPKEPRRDPRDSNATILEVSGNNVHLEGLQLRGGKVGLQLKPQSQTTLRDIDLRTNTVGLDSKDIAGLDARDLSLIRNTEIGGNFSYLSDDVFPLELMDLRVEGNGQRGVSEVGGIHSDHPLVLTRAHFQDNTGTVAGDLHTQGLDAVDLHIGQAFSLDPTPRVQIFGTTVIREALIHLLGSSIHIHCEGQLLSLVNLALSDQSVDPTNEPNLVIQECEGEIQHLTLAKLVGDPRGTGLHVLGESDVLLENSALVNYAEPYLDEEESLELKNNFVGDLTEAALLSPIGAQPNLRPQRDSPLVNAASDIGIQRDLEGWSRPLGGAPDIGAYERR